MLPLYADDSLTLCSEIPWCFFKSWDDIFDERELNMTSKVGISKSPGFQGCLVVDHICIHLPLRLWAHDPSNLWSMVFERLCWKLWVPQLKGMAEIKRLHKTRFPTKTWRCWGCFSPALTKPMEAIIDRFFLGRFPQPLLVSPPAGRSSHQSLASVMRFDDSTGCLSSPSHGLVGRFLCRRMQEKALLFPENNFSRLRGNLGIVSWQVDFVSRKTLSLSLSLPIYARLRDTAHHRIEFIILYVCIHTAETCATNWTFRFFVFLRLHEWVSLLLTCHKDSP